MKNKEKLLEAIAALLEQAEERVLIMIYFMLLKTEKG